MEVLTEILTGEVLLGGAMTSRVGNFSVRRWYKRYDVIR